MSHVKYIQFFLKMKSRKTRMSPRKSTWQSEINEIPTLSLKGREVYLEANSKFKTPKSLIHIKEKNCEFLLRTHREASLSEFKRY